jgi:hypothetical protein
VENTAEEAGQNVREGAENVDNAAEDAVDDVRGYSPSSSAMPGKTRARLAGTP